MNSVGHQIEKHSKSWNFWGDRSFTNFSNIAFFEKWLQILTIVRGVKLRAKDVDHKATPYRASSVHFATGKFRLFRKLPVWMQTFKSSNNTVFTRKIFSRKCYHSLYWLISLKLLDWSFCLHSCTKKCTGISPLHTIVINSAFRTPHCIFHFSSDCNEIAGELNHKLVNLVWFSGICFLSLIPCYSNFKLLYSHRKCAKWLENFWLQNGLNLLCMI